MAIKSLIFDYQTAEDEYTASDFREVYKHFVSNGVLLEKEDSLLDNTKCKIVTIEGGVRVSNGTAQINGSQAIITDEDILIETDGTYKIVLEWNVVLNKFVAKAITTSLTRTDTVYQIQLATVIKSGTTYTVTDTRSNEAVCGFANRMLDNQADNLKAQIENGWNPLTATLVYQSKDSSTATNGTMYTVKLTTNIDLTQLAELGCRFKFSHDNTVKYGILVDKDATSITLLLKLGTSVLDGTKPITDIYYSPAKCPVGFSVSPDDWALRKTDTVWRYATSGSTPALVVGTWINLGGLNIDVLAGAWDISHRSLAGCKGTAAAVGDIWTTLSTSSSSESDILLSRSIAAMSPYTAGSLEAHKKIALSTKTRYYFNLRAAQANTTQIEYGLSYHPTVLEAVCIYL